MAFRKNSIRKEIGFSPKEWEIVCRRSEELKMRTGTYIRTIAVQGEIKVYDLKEFNDVYRAMNRIGVNLNQIASVVNSTGSVYQKDMEDVLTEMKQLQIVFENWLEPLEPEVLL